MPSKRAYVNNLPKAQKGVRPGGRQKGTPNKKTELVETICKRHKYDPIEAMIVIAKDAKQPITLRADMHAKVAEYRHPKRKAIEVDTYSAGKIEFVVTWGSPVKQVESSVAQDVVVESTQQALLEGKERNS